MNKSPLTIRKMLSRYGEALVQANERSVMLVLP